MGVSAVAPSAAKLAEWTAREQRVIDRGGMALPPDPAGAVSVGPCGLAGLRTLPPRENGGNFDAKQLTKEAKLFLPVFKEGALFSTGDGHAAQGDGEVDGTAIETALTGTFEFNVKKKLGWKMPRAETPTHYITFGLDTDLDDAARQALKEMIAWIVSMTGIHKDEAYAMCSFAGDLHVTQTVNNVKGVHAMLLKSILKK